MSEKPFPCCFTAAEFEQFQDLFEINLLAIARAREESKQPYPDTVKEILERVWRVPLVNRYGQFVCPDDRLGGVSKQRVYAWVVEKTRGGKADDAAWDLYAKQEGRAALREVPKKILELMQGERRWRFWSQFALTCHQILSDDVALKVPKTTKLAVGAFVHGAAEVRNALSALLADPRVLRRVSPQEIPMLRNLHESLPSLIETFEDMNLDTIYPYKNIREDARLRTVGADIAELAWRNLGHCNAGVLAELLSDLGVEFNNKWFGEQSARALRRVEEYEKQRYVLHVRLPLDRQEDPYRPCIIKESPWLGNWVVD
ncbi:hypothetical protein [Zoogloea sp.]|uniref:hypothetical protein n=1 Tax=Zoogloea sp. TaxID=49181 RepID=UPI0014162297|nr:MAG: hypothetical protein F9K15_16370 [Zoogloea sp.]